MLVDRQRRIIRVRAAPLPDASLATYRTLETRAAALQSEWSIRFIPPRLPLPELTDPPGEAVGTAAWAAQRLESPVFVSGDGAEDIAAALREAGADARLSAESSGQLRLRWTDGSDQ